MNKWLKKFEEKFGLDAYNEILKELGRLSQKTEDLQKSRDNWKEKYLKIKNK